MRCNVLSEVFKMKARAHTHRDGESMGNLKRFSKLFPIIRMKEDVFLEAGIPTSSHLEGVKRRALNLFSPTLS